MISQKKITSLKHRFLKKTFSGKNMRLQKMCFTISDNNKNFTKNLKLQALRFALHQDHLELMLRVHDYLVLFWIF